MIAPRPHSCAFTDPTLHPDFRRCAYAKCGAVQRVTVTRPAPAIESSETSKAAAREIGGSSHLLRVKVYQILRGAGVEGLTDEEMQDTLEMAGSTQRPRRVELVADGSVVDSGRTRPARSGRQATIWVAR